MSLCCALDLSHLWGHLAHTGAEVFGSTSLGIIPLLPNSEILGVLLHSRKQKPID